MGAELAKASDRLVKLKDIRERYDQEIRIELDDPDMEKEVLPNLVRLVRREPPMGFIRYSRLTTANAEAAIRAQIEFFDAQGLPFEWDAYDYDQPKDLTERLLSLGFEPDLPPDDPGAVLVLDLQEPPAPLLAPINVDVRQLLASEELHEVVRVEEEVWGGDFGWLRTRLASHLEVPGYLTVFVAHVDAEPASCGWIYCYPGSQFAVLRGGSTVPAKRRRGLYTGVLAARVQHAIRRGYRYLVVDAAPSSRPILEEHGFRLLTFARSYKRYPENEG